MRTLAEIRQATRAVPEAAEAVIDAGDRLKRGVDAGVAVLVMALAMATLALIGVAVAIGAVHREPR